MNVTESVGGGPVRIGSVGSLTRIAAITGQYDGGASGGRISVHLVIRQNELSFCTPFGVAASATGYFTFAQNIEGSEQVSVGDTPLQGCLPVFNYEDEIIISLEGENTLVIPVWKVWWFDVDRRDWSAKFDSSRN